MQRDSGQVEMLETVFFMFIAGCSEDMSLCEQIAAPPVPYASNEDCLLALSGAVMTTRSNWPVTTGDCRRTGLDPELVFAGEYAAGAS